MNKTNLLVDAGILIAFVIAMEPRFSGIAVHEWLSLALAATIVIHLLLHWSWITAVAVRFFKNLWHTSRLKFMVDLLLFVMFVTVMVSGLMISRSVLPGLGIQLQQTSLVWRRLHSLSADSSILLVGLHFALNWGWVVSMVKRYTIFPLLRLFRPAPDLQPVTISNNEDTSLGEKTHA